MPVLIRAFQPPIHLVPQAKVNTGVFVNTTPGVACD